MSYFSLPFEGWGLLPWDNNVSLSTELTFWVPLLSEDDLWDCYMKDVLQMSTMIIPQDNQ